jgi:hypothetical protein
MPTPIPLPAALIVGHPGHELRLFHWLKSVRPMVCVLTDGSGSGRSRISSSLELAADRGSTPGPVMGAFTDAALYEAMMRGEIETVAAATQAIANALVERRVQCVVADAFEFYNPTHDLCAIVATLAVRLAQASTGLAIQSYDYAVTARTPTAGIVLHLDAADVERKMAAARRFENLSNDVDALLAALGTNDLTREVLRPVDQEIVLPLPERMPDYEAHGEQRVKAGRYSTVLRYEEHFVPFVSALAAAFGFEVVPEPVRAAGR